MPGVWATACGIIGTPGSSCCQDKLQIEVTSTVSPRPYQGVVVVMTRPELCWGAVSRSVALPQPGSVSRSVAPVAIEGYSGPPGAMSDSRDHAAVGSVAIWKACAATWALVTSELGCRCGPCLAL